MSSLAVRTYLLALVVGAGCQTTESKSAPKPPATIVATDASGAVVARVTSSRPCRATVDGFELLVGGRPLVAQNGADRWTGDDAENGTTLRKNDQQVARIHAKQLFDHEGVPLLRVLDNGDIIDKSNAIVRKAIVADGTVKIGELTITGTTDVVLAAFITAREAVPEVRALAACHLLLEK